MKAIKKVKPQLHIPGESLFYADKQHSRFKNRVIYGKLLRCEKHGLTGKPDYIFKRGRRLVPVELKSGAAKGLDAPRDGDLLQLAAYFVIVKSAFRTKPRFGRLVYGDCMFIVKNSGRLRRRLFRTVRAMRGMLAAETPPLAEPGFVKCRYCVCRETVCAGGVKD